LDPLAGDFAGWSAYNYVLGNPIKFVDPDGRAVVDPVVVTSQTTVAPFYRENKSWAGVLVTQTTKTTSTKHVNDGSILGHMETTVKTETVAVQYDFKFEGADRFEMKPSAFGKSSVTEVFSSPTFHCCFGEAPKSLMSKKEGNADHLVLNSGTEQVLDGVSAVADKVGASVQQQEAGAAGDVAAYTTDYGPLGGDLGAVIGMIAQDIQKNYDLGDARIHHESKGTVDSHGQVKLTSDKIYDFGKKN